MRLSGLTGAVLTSLFLMGCATTGGRNYQTDIDALNARVSALQGELSEKDSEISGLKNQVEDERLARQAAETALRSTPAPAAPAKKTVTDFK